MQTISYLPLKDEKKGTTCIPKGPPSPEISTVLVISLKKRAQRNTSHLLPYRIFYLKNTFCSKPNDLIR